MVPFLLIFFQEDSLINPTTNSPNGSLIKSLSSMNGRSNGRCLSLEQEELINRLVFFQDQFEQPSEEDLKRLSVSCYLFFFYL